METITWNDFEKVNIRVGTVIKVWEGEGLRVPAYRMEIDFGEEIGVLKTSAQLTVRYKPEDLLNKKVVAVVNFPPKQIGKFISECLVLGAVDGKGDVALLGVEADVKNGLRIT